MLTGAPCQAVALDAPAPTPSAGGGCSRSHPSKRAGGSVSDRYLHAARGEPLMVPFGCALGKLSAHHERIHSCILSWSRTGRFTLDLLRVSGVGQRSPTPALEYLSSLVYASLCRSSHSCGVKAHELFPHVPNPGLLHLRVGQNKEEHIGPLHQAVEECEGDEVLQAGR